MCFLLRNCQTCDERRYADDQRQQALVGREFLIFQYVYVADREGLPKFVTNASLGDDLPPPHSLQSKEI